MMLWEYCFVSRSRLDDATAEVDVIRMAHDLQACNAKLEIGGALIWSGRFFAQILEGDRAAVYHIMDCIRSDQRHNELCCLIDMAAPLRSFNGWTLAFGRPSRFVERQIELTLPDAPVSSRLIATQKLKQFMLGMAIT